jgi:lipid-binding SYLF domain-containing protein
MKALLLLSLLATPAVIAADKCDCAHFPIKPKTCARECAAIRLDSAADILDEAFRNPDNGISPDAAAFAKCVMVVPGINVAGTGHGFASCREPRRNGWTAPAAVEIEGGGFGLLVGRSQSDLIILVMSSKAVEELSQTKLAIGGDVSVAAGPVGRDAAAQTDARMHIDLLAYSQRRGVFGGISVNGTTLRTDEAVNQDVYGPDVNNQQILAGEVKPPDFALKLLDVLDRKFRLKPR